MKSSQLALKPGDVIQTEPQPGYWGCAVVLSSADGPNNTHPRFHVGITPVVFRHDYVWSELNADTLSILEFSRSVRSASGEYGARAEVCIGIYTVQSQGDVRVLGEVDPKAVYALPLTESVGDGTGGQFPLCGPLTKTIGSEAVIAWRRIHDADNLANEVTAARRRFEELEAKRISRQSRSTRRRDA
jgi:hypothetical protein